MCPSHRCCVHRVDLILCLWIEWIVTFYIVSFLPGAIFSLSKKHDMMKFPRNPKTSYTLPTKEQSSGKVTFHLTYVELIRRQFTRVYFKAVLTSNPHLIPSEAQIIPPGLTEFPFHEMLINKSIIRPHYMIYWSSYMTYLDGEVWRFFFFSFFFFFWLDTVFVVSPSLCMEARFE